MIIQTIKCWPHCVGEIRLSVAHRCRACITRVAIHRQHTQHRLSACRYKTCTLTRQPHAAPHEHFCSPPSAMHITVPRRCTMITRENGQLHEARPDFYKNHSGSAFALSRSNIISNTFQLNETTKLPSTGPITSSCLTGTDPACTASRLAASEAAVLPFLVEGKMRGRRFSPGRQPERSTHGEQGLH